MRKRNRVLAVVLSSAMALSLAACGGTETDSTAETTTDDAAVESTEETTTEEEATASEGSASEETSSETSDDASSDDSIAVYATSTFGQKFSPFFYTTAYDGEVVEMTTGYLLASDRGGAIIENGIEGETVNYNGTDYTYNGMGDVEVVQNDDGTVDYNLTMRDDIVFSDGTPADIDDVIFGIYVQCDPTYDGSSTLYALPIEGMEDYRNGMQTMASLILDAGDAGYTENEYYTQEQYDEYWTAFNTAGETFAQEIVDYCIANYADYGATDVSTSAALWGFEGLAEDATAADFFKAICEAYEYSVTDMEGETAGSSLAELIAANLGDDLTTFETGVAVGDGAANIAGIERTGDYTMSIHMTQYDATAIYSMQLIVAPLHYYGDESLYDYENNSFGFTKGDLSIVKSKTTEPMGCGPYVFEGYSNGVVTLTANASYFKGEPEIKTLLLQEGTDADYVPGIVTGTYDIAVPSISDDTLNAIQDANSNGEIVGDTITTYLVDYRGYGYIGINADLVNVDGDPGSDASKNLRKGIMTVLAVYRDTVINSYYGDRASVIQYPISNTSWAAPKPADEGYQIAYSTDVDGNSIYDDSMTEEDKYAAALQAAIGYFQAAGYTYDEASGTFTDGWEFEFMIPGQGEGDHPAYGIGEAASEALASIGMNLIISDVGTSEWNNALEGNTAELWAAAWQASVDPDMTQVYHSENAHGNGTNSNHYAVDDEELDALIVEGRSSADTEYRKSVYKEAMEIIMDWGCELPIYQRKDCTTVSTERINVDTVTPDMTPYWGWSAQVETLEVQ